MLFEPPENVVKFHNIFDSYQLWEPAVVRGTNLIVCLGVLPPKSSLPFFF